MYNGKELLSWFKEVILTLKMFSAQVVEMPTITDNYLKTLITRKIKFHQGYHWGEGKEKLTNPAINLAYPKEKE